MSCSKRLSTLEKWPEKVRLMQANWIGRSEGLMMRWRLDPATVPAGETELEIFTTRPDTLFGASFMAIAPDHPLAKSAAAKDPKLAAFCDECRRMGTSVAEIETAEKKGFDTGIKAVHPFDPGWTVPVFVANFILMDYGTGAIFGCPGPRSARHRIRQGLRAADHSRGRAERRRAPAADHRENPRGRAVPRRRRDDQLAVPRRPDA